MITPAPKLLHLAPHARGYGGIEMLLERHVAIDARLGYDARQIGLFNRPSPVEGERDRAMGFGWKDTPHKMRRAMAGAFGESAGALLVWHNAWGLPWFADLDGALRRVVCLHADERYFAAWLPAMQPYLDGILTVSPRAKEAAARLLPGFPADRILCLPLAIAPPPMADLARPERRRILVGCAGRLVREQKRWDRLVPFVAELRRLGVAFQLEIVGEGPLRPWLEAQFGGASDVALRGVLAKEEYWRQLRAWDAAVFFSDIEGGPLVLIEAMAMGAIPIYPAIGGSLGDDYVPRLDPRCYYPAGDPVGAARMLAEVMATPPAQIAALRTKAREMVADHRDDAYERAYGSFLQQIKMAARISRLPGWRRPAQWTDRIPLGLITRLFPQALWR